MKPVLFILPFLLSYCSEALYYWDDIDLWYVKNCTRTSVVVDCSSWKTGDNVVSVEPGDSVNLWGIPYFESVGHSPYDGIFTHINSDNNWSFSIIKDGATVRTWTGKDESTEGRHFRNADCWRKTEYGDVPSKRICWTFDILPEDIIPADF